MNRETDAVLAAIDGALADGEFPDGMRWSPQPEAVDDAPAPYDGELVWQPPQRYEDTAPAVRWVPRRDEQQRSMIYDDALGWIPRGPRPGLGGARVDLVIVDDPIGFVPRAAVEAALELERAREALIRVFAETAEALAPIMEALGRYATEAGASLAEVLDRFRVDYEARQVGKCPPPPPALRDRDPRAYALALRSSRGTGPARLVQHQHRPRRHN